MIRAVDQCHAMLRERVRPGDVVVDATAGNGNDTLFLARLVGAEGRVYAFDIQKQALEATRRLLHANGIEPGRVRLRAAGHETMAREVEPSDHGRIAAVVFNLGYLPGGDKKRITRPETTVAALRAAVRLLAPDGRIAVVLYTGHPGGKEEADAVRAWAATLPPETFRISGGPEEGSRPVCLGLEKRGTVQDRA